MGLELFGRRHHRRRDIYHGQYRQRGYYQITGITGIRNGSPIIALEPTGDAIPQNAGYPVDNLITASGLLTGNGFFEFFSDPGNETTSEPAISFRAGIVSEPGTIGVMLAGLVGLAAIGRRRAR